MKNTKWATPRVPREQLVLMSPSLDDMISADHRIRNFEKLTHQLNWSDWESHYHDRLGQPPIHPRLIAGAILYGLTRQIRSSRSLEDASNSRIDFMWFLEGRTVDHSTFANFRKRFKEELKDLFQELALIALQGGTEVELAIDGTRIRSNSSRTGAPDAEGLKRQAEKVAAELTERLERMEAQDIVDDPENSAQEDLQREINRLQERQSKLRRALEVSAERDADKKKRGNKSGSSCKIPVSDPDSHLMPNKEGGFAPNYTPTVGVDTHSDVIVHADVPEGSDEASVVSNCVSAVEELTGKAPSRVLADSAFSTGPNLKEMSDNSIEFFSPADKVKDNPAVREDASEPVPDDQLEALPKTNRTNSVFSREAFVYDYDKDCFWCPAGTSLSLARIQTQSNGKKVNFRIYRGAECQGCHLASQCLSKTTQKRTIHIDEFERYRVELRSRMEHEFSQEIYKRRAPSVEGVFARIKHVMRVRQFLLRGIENVRTEWHWVCSAYNVKKILKQMDMNAATS